MRNKTQIGEGTVVSRSSWFVIPAALLTVLFVTALVVVSSIRAPVLDIRIRNATGLDLQDVVVGRGHYGKIRHGEVSGYESWGPAYRYARVSLVAEGKQMRLQPMDYFGETPLGAGRFTYILSIRRISEGEEWTWPP